MRQICALIATSVSWFCLLLAGCAEEPPASPSGLPYCWIHDCPTDPGETTCGTCKHPGVDTECPPGFVCSCDAVCLKGPRSYDAGVSCWVDAGVEDPTPDAQTFSWPACDPAHLP